MGTVSAMAGNFGSFDDLLATVLRERRREAEAPLRLEQRLKARLEQEAQREVEERRPRVFSFAESVATRRSATSIWAAVGAHAVVFALVAIAVAQQVTMFRPKSVDEIGLTVPPPPPKAITMSHLGGGGGQAAHSPATQGHLPKPADQQIVPPKAPPTVTPKIAIEPTVVVQKNLQMADMKAPELGIPNSTLDGFSMGDGRGSGLGSGTGSGIGPGSGGNIGGGPMHVGGAVSAPVLTYQVEPEFSEEARKAKFSGNVQVYLWVDEHGNPSHVRVVRGVGMGLDQKAADAVRQYKFKPAMKDGKPVKVDLYVEVNFAIF